MADRRVWTKIPFPCERFRFTAEVRSLMLLPPYKGGVLHGAMGDALRRAVCSDRSVRCNGCTSRAGCLYARTFDPAPPPDFADSDRFQQPPRPYVLTPPLTARQAFHPGDLLEFELVLMGSLLDALPYFVHVFLEAGKRGLGRERGRYRLLRVDLLRPEGGILIYDGKTGTLSTRLPANADPFQEAGEHTRSLTLRMVTPLRLKEKGCLVTRLSFPLFIERLLQRISLLSRFCGPGLFAPECSRLLDDVDAIRVTDDRLHWYDWERYSSRQKEAMKFGGLMGSVRLEGSLAPLLPLLRWGELVHAGQGTTFGLGKLHIEL